jgi:hypothetical protein
MQQVTDADGNVEITLTQRRASNWEKSSLRTMAERSKCTDKAKAALKHFIEQEKTVRPLVSAVAWLQLHAVSFCQLCRSVVRARLSGS